MKWPPFFMKLRFYDGKHRFGLWIPLFLIGPIVLALLLVVFAVVLVVALLGFVFTWQWDWLYWVVAGFISVIRVLHLLSGVKVDVDTPDVKVYIAIQ
ncbi:MAG: hypothetical protein JW856_04315 [Dehalococcoidales bacterium]|nr:hypothetical protein [Dehalococcoidales bacterium]